MYLVEQIILQYGWCRRKKLREISLKKFEDPSKKKKEDRRDLWMHLVEQIIIWYG
jgi:hypothetical protein